MAEGSTRRGPVAKHGARGKVNLRERDRLGGGMKRERSGSWGEGERGGTWRERYCMGRGILHGERGERGERSGAWEERAGEMWEGALTSFRASFFRCEAIARISLEGEREWTNGSRNTLKNTLHDNILLSESLGTSFSPLPPPLPLSRSFSPVYEVPC